MKKYQRREFLSDVTKGMIIAGLGPCVADQLGVTSAFADEGPGSLNFGDLHPLVGLIQDTSPEKLQPILAKKLKGGETDLRQLIAAASLANAETFGGEDYVGFHTEMALVPALRMSERLPEAEKALPVLKVIYRNAGRIQEVGGAKKKTLHPLPETIRSGGGAPDGETLRAATREGALEKAEDLFGSMTRGSLEDAYNHLQWIVQDDMNVHRFVLAHRVWELVDIVGPAHAHTILRQSVRFCVNSERNLLSNKDRKPSPIRILVPKLLDQHHLIGRPLGTKEPDDAWVEELSQLIYTAGKERATDAVAAALAEGMSPEAVGEAISLAANQLALRQGNGRVHGDSRGVHGSDAMNAWRNMNRVTIARNTVVGLLVGAYHTAEYSADPNVKGEPYPHEAHRNEVKATTPDALLKEAEGAIRENNQSLAAAAIHRYGDLGHPPKPVFDLMLKYAISEDGRLHAEKYLQTVTEEFATTRPAFRWRQLVALARVTASAYGFDRKDQKTGRAPGYENARLLMGV